MSLRGENRVATAGGSAEGVLGSPSTSVCLLLLLRLLLSSVSWGRKDRKSSGGGGGGGGEKAEDVTSPWLVVITGFDKDMTAPGPRNSPARPPQLSISTTANVAFLIQAV